MAITHSGGQTIIPVAELADVTADVNLTYPNGIGKRKGLEVVVDNGTILQKAIARGSAAADLWDVVGDGAAAATIDPV